MQMFMYFYMTLFCLNVLSGSVSGGLRYIAILLSKVKVIAMLHDTHDLQVHPSTYLRIAQLQSSALFPCLRYLYFTL